jgi:MoxR-like ATPase
MVKLLVGYPQEGEYHDILLRTTETALPHVETVSSGQEVLAMRKIVRSVAVSEQVRRYAIRLMMATQPGSPHAPRAVQRTVALGSSPRGAQGLLMMGKVRALIGGRFAVSCQDVRDVAKPVLRHRIIFNFEGQSERVNVDDLLDGVVESVGELSE